MKRYQLSIKEKITLALVTIILITGYILLYSNLTLFNKYVEEDGLVEWLTVLGLVLGFIVCVYRFFTLAGKRNWWFLTVTLLLGLLLFFGAGEEISWGQRILGIKSSAYFTANNTQQETNFHNLVIGGVRLNKLIFSILLSIGMGIYLIVFPLLYQLHSKSKTFFNYSGIPVARMYQVISFALLIITTSLLRHEKNAELLECGTALLLFLIIRYPKNEAVFTAGILTPDL